MHAAGYSNTNIQRGNVHCTYITSNSILNESPFSITAILTTGQALRWGIQESSRAEEPRIFSSDHMASILVRGRYRYMEDLTWLDSHRRQPGLSTTLAASQPALPSVVLANSEQALESHPVQRFKQFILHGLTHSFHVGFNSSSHPQAASWRAYPAAVSA